MMGRMTNAETLKTFDQMTKDVKITSWTMTNEKVLWADANTAILNSVSSLGTSPLLSLVGNGAQLELCPDASLGSIAFDTRPDDLRRIRVRIGWTPSGGTAGSLTQTTLLTTPG